MEISCSISGKFSHSHDQDHQAAAHEYKHSAAGALVPDCVSESARVLRDQAAATEFFTTAARNRQEALLRGPDALLAGPAFEEWLGSTS